MTPQGWECPKCGAVFAPFIPRCVVCEPRRNYEVLDPHIPREPNTTFGPVTTTLDPSRETS